MQLRSFSIGFLKILLTCLSLACLFLGCSKKQVPAKITLDFSSQNGSLANNQPSTIVVNLNSQVYHWECDRDNCDFLEIEVDQPISSLLQVLVLTEDEADDETTANYGDRFVELKAGQNDVDIQLENVGTFTNESQVIGRYVPQSGFPMAGKYLTGKIDTFVHIGNGKPDMKVMEHEIFGGWINIFALDSIGFKFKFTGYDKGGIEYTNTSIFTDLHGSGGLVLTSAGIQPNSNIRTEYDSTEDYWESRGDNVFKQKTFPRKVIGFFGANPNSNRLCAEYLAPNSLMDGQSGEGRACKLSNGISCQTWYQWMEVEVSSSLVSGSSDTCAGNSSHFPVNLHKTVDGGGDELLGVSGAFIKKASVGQSDLLEVTADGSKISWVIDDNAYIPGGVEVFVRTQSGDFNRDDVRGRGDGIDCSALKDFGFNSIGIKSQNRGQKTNINVPASQASLLASGQGYVAICPFDNRSGEYFESALMSDHHYGNPTMGPPPSHVEYEIYLSDFTTIAPNFEFGGVHWDDHFPYILESTPGGGAMDMYLVIRNKLPESVTLSNISTELTVGDFTIVSNPGSTPNGWQTCSAASMTLAPEDGAATDNDLCVVRLDFNVGATYTADGLAVHNGIFVEAYKVADSNDETHSFIPVIGQTLATFDPYTNNLTIDMYAPAGKVDAKTIVFENNDPVTPWSHDLPASGSTPGFYQIHHNCPGVIANGGGSCTVVFVMDNRSGSVGDGTTAYASYDFGFAMNTLTSTIYAGELVSSEGDPYDFQSFNSNQSHNFSLTNSSAAIVQIGPLSIGGTHFSLSAGTTDCLASPTLSTGTPCDYDIDVTYSSGFGFDQSWLSLKYENSGTYRKFEFEVFADHQ